jgi:hypothetical protein
MRHATQRKKTNIPNKNWPAFRHPGPASVKQHLKLDI